MTTTTGVEHTGTADRLAMRAVRNYARANMSETWLDETSVVLRDTRRFRHYAGLEADHFWLIVDGTAMAYLHTMFHPEYPEGTRHVLCDIEVREAFRGTGLARRIVQAAETALGATLHTTGSFTPLGAQSLAWVPVLPHHDAGVKFDDMGFVEDWDNLIPNNAL